MAIPNSVSGHTDMTGVVQNTLDFSTQLSSEEPNQEAYPTPFTPTLTCMYGPDTSAPRTSQREVLDKGPHGVLDGYEGP